jgi:hypothetical protein
MRSFYTTGLFGSQKRSNGAKVEVQEPPVNTGAINGCQTGQKIIFDLESSCSIHLSYERNRLNETSCVFNPHAGLAFCDQRQRGTARSRESQADQTLRASSFLLIKGNITRTSAFGASLRFA